MTEEELMAQLLALRGSVADEAAMMHDLVGGGSRPTMLNLAHYLALRHTDVRPLQRELAWRGLSSIGRLESRVLPTIDATINALAGLLQRPSPFPHITEEKFFAGEELLEKASTALFGPQPPTRDTRIMVTMPSEAASDAGLVEALVVRGMDVARINCAHDTESAWRAIAANVQRAARRAGRNVPLLFDIAGPKIRTDKVAAAGHPRQLEENDVVRLVGGTEPRLDDRARFCATVSIPGVVARLNAGDRVGYNDGKLSGVVEWAGEGEVLVRVSSVQAGGCRLKPEKGLNFPDSDLGLSPLTAKDHDDLRVVADCADLVGYSFVSQPDDIDLLEAALAAIGTTRPLGLILKLERPQAVTNLPRLIARAGGRRPLGVMIARGDLAAEIGFERLAEIQEEILWICEAASVPVIWATQVLDELARTGVPSRGEMTDAAMAARAECVMLNKGPAINQALETLDRLLGRMDQNTTKKTPTLRRLNSW